MKVKSRKRFIENLEAMKDVKLLDDADAIVVLASQVDSPEKIPGFKWLSGHSTKGRIRIESYRIGVDCQSDTIIFVCVLPREIIYKEFP